MIYIFTSKHALDLFRFGISGIVQVSTVLSYLVLISIHSNREAYFASSLSLCKESIYERSLPWPRNTMHTSSLALHSHPEWYHISRTANHDDIRVGIRNSQRAALHWQVTVNNTALWLNMLFIAIGNSGEGLYNISLTFGPDGKVCNITSKCNLIPEERAFMDRGELSEVTAFDTPLGKVGSLICADSWSPRMYKQFDDQGVEILTSGSFVSPGEEWNKPWPGYNILEGTPNDVDRKDIQNALLKDMWKKVPFMGSKFYF